MIENVSELQRETFVKVERIFGLDLMRSCSIIMVFLAHSTPLNPVDKLFPFGWLGVGVEAFFVLSGFLIGRIILRTVLTPGITWKAVRIFWVNRWLRTLPAYFFAFLICYQFSGAMHNSIYYLFFAQNIITPMPGFFPHSWSLAVEEWFYLLFPLLLLAIAAVTGRTQNRYRIYLAGVIIFLVCGLGFKVLYHWMYQQNLFAYLVDRKILFPSWNIFAPPIGDWDSMRKIVMFRLDAIACGCLIAYLMEKRTISSRASMWLLATGFVGVLIGFQIVKHTVAGGKANIFVDVLLLPLFCCGFAMMLPYASSCPRPGKLITSVITQISQTSYSFYLMHILIIEQVTEWYHSNLANPFAPKWLVFLGTYLFTYLVAYLMFRLIELPFMNLRKRLFVPAIDADKSYSK
jgi:peptidoglycan/LPS O-acetylase OafA/YrhL